MRQRDDQTASAQARVPRSNGQSGFLLVTVLLITVVIGILVVGTSFTSLIDRQVAARQRVGTEAYYIAQAGLDRIKTALFLELSDLHGEAGAFCGIPEFDVDLGGDVLVNLGVTTAPISAFDGAGYYQLRFSRNQGFYVLTSVGWLGGEDDRAAQATIQLVATAGVWPFGAWDNAIFTEQLTSGTGMTTGTIAAYGSVHVANAGLALDDTVFDATGTSGVFNNYKGRNQATNAVAQATKALGGGRANPYDLCSRLKVEEGNVRVRSNAARIGAPGDVYEDGEWFGVGATGVIESVEGVYLGTGTVVDQQGNPISSLTQEQIYSRSGISSGYRDLHLDFPQLPLGFPEEVDAPGQIVLNEANCGLIVDGVLRLPPPLQGQTRIVCGADPDSDTSVGAHGMVWNEITKQLTVMGTIAIPDATVAFHPRTGDEPVDVLVYNGMGQLRVGTKNDEPAVTTGRVEVGMELLPADPGQNFLSAGLAFVTAGDIDFAGVTGSGATVSGLFYAEGRINLPQQVSIVGSVVGRNVHVQQVPRVLYHEHVAALAENMCLIGSVCSIGDFGYTGPWSEVSTEIR